MITLFNSLTEISDGYTVFEKDQVLTETQLNSVAQYLDDHDRLTRISLVGVGIVCGLRATYSGATVTLSKGVGITTDGDLLRVGTATHYNKFKLYDNQSPKYPQLYIDNSNMLTVYELLREDDTHPLASNLNQFNSSTGSSLSNMVVLLLMESYIKNSNLCTGTDCDNRGCDYISTQRLLLVEKSSVGQLLSTIQTADSAAQNLSPIISQRVKIASNLTTQAQLTNRYHSACETMHTRISNELPKVWGNISFLLQEKFSSNPSATWSTKLNSIRADFSSNNRHIQYYYDFLNDVIETWNEMHNLLFGETAWCCPDINGFPKHLLLGNLVPDSDSISSINDNRTGFYPSKAIDRGVRLQEVQFLVQKIDALIKNFAPPTSSGTATTIRVTPSHTALQTLQNRAIPYYYQINATTPIHEYWSFKLQQRGMSAYNYSYHADSYSALGAAASPLDSTINSNNFFRIEGHIGQNVISALNTIESNIENQNLPFAVCSVLLGTNKDNIPNKKGAGYTDLHRLHYLFRQDTVHKLDEATQFSQAFKNNIDQAVDSGTIKNDVTGNDSVSIKTITADKNSTVTSKAAAAKGKLNISYMNYVSDSSWMSDIGDTMVAAGQFKADLSKVVSTSYVTSFDHLIGNMTLNWLPWLDGIILDKDDKADKKKLFHNFAKEHPGLEHTGGVVRGGTFVLVHDDEGTVIADFMLSHYVKETPEDPAEEPPLMKPAIPKGNIINGGIRITKSWDNYITDKLDIFKGTIDEEWVGKFDIYNAYADAFKDSVQLWQGNWQDAVAAGNAGIAGVGSDVSYDDSLLGAITGRARNGTALIKLLEDKLSDNSLPPEEKEFYEKELAQSQETLAKDVERIAVHIDMQGSDVSQGTEGYRAMKAAGNGVMAIRNNTAVNNFTDDYIRQGAREYQQYRLTIRAKQHA